MRNLKLLLAIFALSIAAAGETSGDISFDVPGQANIYGSGHAVPPDPGGGGGGVLPPMVLLPNGVGRTLTFISVSDSVCYGPPCGWNGPDGVESDFPRESPTWDGLAGPTPNPVFRYLSAVFLDGAEPAPPAPPPLEFTTTAFDTLAPGLRQIFFAGDGLTGTAEGSSQVFLVPDDARRLFLGFIDYGVLGGPPGWYGDNSGALAVTLRIGGADTAGVCVGSIVAWGRNEDGECDVPEPNDHFIAIAAGVHHSLGLRADSSLVIWGDCGACDLPEPNSGFVGIAVGYSHNLGLRADGSIVAWGSNYHGECNVPAPNADFVTVAAGYHHSLGLKSDGLIVAWGNNHAGQLNVPAPNAGFIAAEGGYGHSIGLKADSSVVVWGSNAYGQCNVPSPNAGFVGVASGDDHCVGLKADGSVVAWGNNDVGQCNVPDSTAAFKAVAAGNFHSLALKMDTSVVGWGSNTQGECDGPLPNAGFVSIAGGERYSLGLTRYPGGACCNEDGTCTLTTQSECQYPSSYLGDGVLCYPSPCPPAGACCQADGSCALVTEGACVESGIWQGPGTICNPNPCITGACCLSAFCQRLTQSECAGYGGTYEGNGTLCEPNPCPTSGVEAGTGMLPLSIRATPNPSTGAIMIEYALPRESSVTIEVFDPAGRLVRRIVEGQRAAGEHSLPWDGKDGKGRELPAGIYFARVVTGVGTRMGRVIVAR